MEWQFLLLAIFGSAVVLLLTGIPVALAFIVINVGVVYFYWGAEGLSQLFLNMKMAVQDWSLLPCLFFILLGEVLFRSRLIRRIIEVVDFWLGKLPGRLGLLAVGAGVIMGALSGSSTASAGLLSATLVPEMENRGYTKPMSLGPVLGSGGLAMMIPPSAILVFIACIAQVSVGKLLIAGIMPGLLMGAFYAIYIILRCYLQPSLAPPYKVPPMPLTPKLKATLLDLVPIVIIIFLVTGVIFVGVATPSEASATGALGVIILAAAYRNLNWAVIKASFLSTIQITTMILAIVFGAVSFGQLLAYTGASRDMTEWLSGLSVSPTVLLGFILLVPLIMGCFIDGVTMTVMLIPLFIPIAHALGFEPIWFIILFVLTQEMGMTTPPFGFILYVVKGTSPPGTTMGDIYKAGLPFLACDAIVMVLMIVFPQIVLWLPAMMTKA